MNENTKRGMSRLCLLLAVLWVLGMGWYQFGGGHKDEGSVTLSLDKNTELRIDSSGIKQTDKNEIQMQKLLLVLGPALVLLLLVPVMGWIGGGFKAEGQPK